MNKILAIALAMVLLAACGSRRTDDEIAAAAGQQTAVAADPGTSVDAAAPMAADASDLSEALDPGQPGGPAAPNSDGAVEPAAGGAVTATAEDCPTELAPLRIGSVGTQSGIIGAIIADSVRGLQAWVKYVNARGGLACHPVELIVGDDGGDPARHRALVQQFVEEKGVVAFVQTTAPLSGQSAIDYLEAKRVPVIGSEGGSDWFYQSPMFFPQMTSGRQLLDVALRGPAKFLVPKEVVRLGTIACQEVQFCTDADR